MGRARVALGLVLVVAMSGLSACDRSAKETPPSVVLDGRARRPDAAGVVESVSRRELVLDGGRRYGVSPDLQSFSSSTQSALSVLQRRGEYVHVGLEGKTAVWIGSIGPVVPLDRPTVFHFGTVVSIDGDQLVFKDGTVLRAEPGLRVVTDVRVRVEIDPATQLVRALISF